MGNTKNKWNELVDVDNETKTVPFCYHYDEPNKQIVVVKKDVKDFYPSTIELDTSKSDEEIANQANMIVDAKNKALNVSAEDKEKLISECEKITESITDTISDEDKLKYTILDRAIYELQSKYNVQVLGWADNNSYYMKITGNLSNILNAWDYINNIKESNKNLDIEIESNDSDKSIIVKITNI